MTRISGGEVRHGYDLQIGTNVLGTEPSLALRKSGNQHYTGHFYFTKLLLPVLLAGAKSSPEGKARIVHRPPRPIFPAVLILTWPETLRRQERHLLVSSTRKANWYVNQFSKHFCKPYLGQGNVLFRMNWRGDMAMRGSSRCLLTLGFC